MSSELLRKAREALAEGDLVQASEKEWGAAAQAIKAVAEHRGWRRDSHWALSDAATRLTQETGDQELRHLFDVAQVLHWNFYEHRDPPGLVEGRLDDVAAFVAKLEPLAAQP